MVLQQHASQGKIPAMSQLDTTPLTLERRAARRLALKSGWFTHATVFALVNLGLWLGWSLAASGPALRHGLPLWGWGLGLAIHGLVVLLKLQGDSLQKRRLAHEMETLRRLDAG
jgi:hypothetical protein